MVPKSLDERIKDAAEQARKNGPGYAEITNVDSSIGLYDEIHVYANGDRISVFHHRR